MVCYFKKRFKGFLEPTL